MFRVRIGLSTGFYSAVWVLAATALIATTDSAAARRHHRHGPATANANGYNPPFASIVVDANSGKVLEDADADAPRHPASLTKIMTLYLLFERLDAGKIKLDTPLKVSEHAASQAPSKLGLDPGDTIEVEDAIRAVVTKSANDMAVVIAEALAGDEGEFARLMTSKAHALGMSHTEYRNASGLPDDNQITTARDLALLGRAIQERFPQYYRYFATPSFTYHGNSMRNHNHLLGSVEGVDGIKTGYTEASGFNLVTSLRRGNRHLVAVIMGGRSAGMRGEQMRELLNEQIAHASERRTAPMIADNAGSNDPHSKSQTFALASAPPSTARAETGATSGIGARPAQGSSDPIKPILVKTIPVKAGAARTASLESTSPQLAPPQNTAPQPSAVPTPQVVTTRPDLDPQTPIINPEPGVLGVLPAHIAAQPIGAQPASAQQMIGPPPAATLEVSSRQALASAPAVASAATSASVQSEAASGNEGTLVSPAQVHTGWMIQVGALEDASEAKARLDLAQSKAHDALARAEAFTETVVKGDKTFYRARFAGLDKDRAEAACKFLKRSDIPCMALKN
jgi:D-alanyl-D-alanine carboxypeptidase